MIGLAFTGCIVSCPVLEAGCMLKAFVGNERTLKNSCFGSIESFRDQIQKKIIQSFGLDDGGLFD